MYNCKLTIPKTLKANPMLIKSTQNKRYLFDFSLLDNYSDSIESDTITDIKNQCLKNITSITMREQYISKPCNIFTTIDYYSGAFFFKAYAIYDNQSGKQLYVIFQLVKIEHFAIQMHESIYDEFTTTQEINTSIGTNYAIDDVFVD